MQDNPYSKCIGIALPAIFGILAFFLVVGHRVLDVENVAWLGEPRVGADAATSYLGWHFFRNDEWRFPPGLNPHYGLEFSNSIVYSDSIPLLAILFKPFSSLLPQIFQYFGIWLIACFVLQAWFAWKLIGIAAESGVVRLLGAGLLVFAPPMIWRLHGHFSLVGHFLILAALYLCFRPNKGRRAGLWSLLITTSALVHGYIFAMVILLWLADLLAALSSNERTLRSTAGEVLVVVLCAFLACWTAGYFSVGYSSSPEGFGLFRMNLLSIIDSSGWSHILRDLPEGPGDYEGFNYLGLGVIIASLFALPVLPAQVGGISSSIKRHPALALVLLVLIAFSASNSIGVGTWNFFLPIPEVLLHAATAFRSSGRMFWPAFYVLVFGVIVVIVRGYDRWTAAALLAIALVAQIIDTSAGWLPISEKLMVEQASEWPTQLRAKFWSQAASKYQNIRRAPPGNARPNWISIADYAGRNRLATDAVYLARVGEAGLTAAQWNSEQAINTGKYDQDSLYILDNEKVHTALLHIDQGSDLFAQIDGLFVVAPGWKKCADCSH